MKTLLSLLILPVLILSGCVSGGKMEGMSVSHIECSKRGFLSFNVLIRNTGDAPLEIEYWNLDDVRNFSVSLDQGFAHLQPVGNSPSRTLIIKPGDSYGNKCEYKLGCTKGVHRAKIHLGPRPGIATSFTFDAPADFVLTEEDFHK